MDLNSLAELQDLSLEEDIEMPVNNRILVWQRNVFSRCSDTTVT
jgi:hypothetical protein